MFKTVAPQRWFSGWRVARPPAYGSDPADLGTAFGLDLSMVENPPHPVPAQRRPGWVRRLTARRRSPP